MTTLTFLGSHITYQPTTIKTNLDKSNVLKYRGVPYKPHQPIVGEADHKGLQFRGSTY